MLDIPDRNNKDLWKNIMEGRLEKNFKAIRSSEHTNNFLVYR